MIPNILDNIIPSYVKANAISNMIERSVPKYYRDMLENPAVSNIIEMSKRQHAMTSVMQKAFESPILDLVKQASALRVPSSIVEALNSINTHHERFAQLVKSIMRPLPVINVYSHNWGSIFQAYNKSISQMISISLKERSWADIENIEELEASIADFPVQGTNLADYYKQVNDWFAGILSKYDILRKKHRLIFFILSVALASRALYISEFGYFKDSQPSEKPVNISNVATKDDLNSIKEIIVGLQSEIKETRDKRTINITAKVYFKPNNQSKVLNTLHQNDEVILLQTNHKWALISYSNHNDEIYTGWILKKYLD